MTHSCVQIYLHIIFATKQRQAIIPPEYESRLYAYLGGISKKRNTQIIKINGTQDHIHLLLKLHPDTPLSQLMKELKAYCTGWMKKQGHLKFSWQIGYGAFSCSINHIEPLIAYIENQKQHHLTQTFEEEIAILNQKWGTSWCILSDENANDDNE